jgi:hypothetical protein
MYARVVRFTEVDADRLDTLISRIEESDELPEGVKSPSILLLHDAEQGSAVSFQLYDTAEDMAEAAKAFEAMDAGDTPGTRVSVDTCEVKLELKPGG